ncbi:MAG: glycosyltransferase [Candidatus Riflebacteria bacterium]|nr:glycosyltransferase [Candidatus Riflebacteria bacterium]
MKIFLGNPPWYREKNLYFVRAGSRWPHFEDKAGTYMPFPFYMAYAATMLTDAGHTVHVCDGVAEGIEQDEYVRRAREFGPELVFSEASTPSLAEDLGIVARMREVLPEAVYGVAGMHAPMFRAEFLEQTPAVDVSFVGEYETTLVELARQMADGSRDFTQIRGLVCRAPDGRIVETGRREGLADADDYPWPARHLFPMDRYHDEPGDIPQPSVQMWGSRNCPYKCNFCVWPQMMYGNNKYRPRSARAIVDEMEHLVRDWGFQSIYFDDDTFNIGRTRMLELAAELQRRRLKVPWAAMCRADLMDRELLENLKRAGLVAVKYGIESSEQSIVSHCGKGLSVAKAIENARITTELGIRMHLTFCFGLPGENRDSARRTKELALQLNPHSAQFSIATPFVGSRYYEELKASGHLESENYGRFDGYRTTEVSTDELSSKDLEEIIADVHRSWLDHTVKRGFQGPAVQTERRGVSVVVPHVQGREMLGECLASLAVQDHRPIEVLVITREPAGPLAEQYPFCRWLETPEKPGFAAAVNAGIRACRGEYVALLNDDATVQPNWLGELVTALEKTPVAGFAASRILRADDRRILDSAGDSVTPCGYAFSRGSGEEDGPRFNEKGFRFGASACAALYRHRMLEDLGLFDEDFESYLEDVDLSLRANLWGYRCLYVPGAVAFHKGGATSGGRRSSQVVRRLARNTLTLMLKSFPREVLKAHAVRISGYLAFMLVYHTLWTWRGPSFARGLLEAWRTRGDTLQKRKKVLGGMRVTAGEAYRILWDGRKDLEEFKRSGLPRLLRALRLA